MEPAPAAGTGTPVRTLPRMLAFAFAVASVYSSRYMYVGPRVLVQVLVLTAFATIIGVLLPGAYVRGDQLEAWALRKLRARQE